MRQFALICLLAALLVACQPPVMLMPTPEALQTGEIDAFELTPPEERSLDIPVIYATNRLPAKDLSHDGYTKKFDDYLRLGVAKVRVGDDPNATWDDLHAISMSAEREGNIPLRLHDVQQYYVLPANVEPELVSPAVDELFEELDKLLQASPDPDLLIFIHGANNGFYRSISQAAQYRHFSGRNTVVLAFVWPSMENILRYGTDIKHALAAAPLLARFIDLTARRTRVRYINLLGYSLGSLVLSHGLDDLRNQYADTDSDTLRQRLRIGEVYYAAADVGVQDFVLHLRNYEDIVGRVTITINPDDSALGFSKLMHGGHSRAGRPDAEQLSEDDLNWVISASLKPSFDIIDINSAVAPYQAFNAHDYWYNNPRVSTDVILLMLSHAPPQRRALTRKLTERGTEIWDFPDDYRERVIEAARKLGTEIEAGHWLDPPGYADSQQTQNNPGD